MIKYRIGRSLEALREAKTLIDYKFWNASVNRIYYSCYYIISAILLIKSIETSSHKGIRQMFGLHFVQTGLVSKEDGRFFSDLYDRRQSSDYDDYVNYDEDKVKKLFSHAEEFVNRMKKIFEI